MAAQEGNLARRLALGTILAIAVTLRISPWFAAHTFGGVLEYDDGVYYAASRALAHGLMPYRDFVVIHPPLSSVLFLPFAALGAWFGDPVGMASARVAVVVISLVNVVLVSRIVGVLVGNQPGAGAARIVGAACYATFPGAVAAEHTLLLEPVVNVFALLGALSLSADHTSLTRRRALVAGVLFAAAVSVKVFATVYLIVAVLAMLAVRNRRAVLGVLTGAVAGLAVFDGPFFLASPRKFWTDVVLTQLRRPPDGTHDGWHRLADLLGVGEVPLAVATVAGIVLVASWLIFAVSAEKFAVIFWLGSIAGFVGAFAVSPSYFTHYADALAPSVAVTVGVAVVAIRRRATAPVTRLVLAPSVLPALFVCSSPVPLLHWSGQADWSAVHRLIPPRSCVYTDAVSLSIAADDFRPPSAECPIWIDGRGVNLTLTGRSAMPGSFYPNGFLTDRRWQQANLRQLDAAGAVLIRGTTADVPEWSTDARNYLLAHFRKVWDSHGRVPASLWIRS
ncbi:MAG: DUF2029 domain-containing protein [Frankiaceae bacterium]|nr:DUF2029 domain-containing protein [Frankiaceae bacterium]